MRDTSPSIIYYLVIALVPVGIALGLAALTVYIPKF